MPEAKRLLDEVVARPQQVVTMHAALHAGWDQVAGRFAGAPQSTISDGRRALANGIINGFKGGANDVLVLKHWGLAAIRTRHPDRFQNAE